MRLALAAGLFAVLASAAAACTDRPAALVGEVAVSPDTSLMRAWYANPTTVYDHAILGRTVTAQVLRTQTALADPDACRTLTVPAGEGHVFEDTAPRLADLDGDGRLEVIAVRTSLTQGAQLAIYGLRNGDLVLLAATPYIGQSHRWLSPIGAGDIDGDGRVELAYIDRPHLARLMRVWRFDGTRLTEAYQIAGLTNHRIGDPAISGGMRACAGVTEAVTATPDWSRIVAVRIAGGKALIRDLGANTGPQDFAAALNCRR